jgi:hypothetical protein
VQTHKFFSHTKQKSDYYIFYMKNLKIIFRWRLHVHIMFFSPYFRSIYIFFNFIWRQNLYFTWKFIDLIYSTFRDFQSQYFFLPRHWVTYIHIHVIIIIIIIISCCLISSLEILYMTSSCHQERRFVPIKLF